MCVYCIILWIIYCIHIRTRRGIYCIRIRQTLKPDIVIIDQKDKSVHIFKLTCPLEEHIEKRHLQKSNKYAHFVTDCSSGTMKCEVTCFEISSRGLITPRNSEHLHTLHTYTQKGIKLSNFMKNISARSVLSSGSVGEVLHSNSPPFFPAPFQDKTKEIPVRTAGH